MAALAPILLPALEQNDHAALRISHCAADDLAELVLAAWRKTNMQGDELALCGGILNHYSPTLDGAGNMTVCRLIMDPDCPFTAGNPFLRQ